MRKRRSPFRRSTVAGAVAVAVAVVTAIVIAIHGGGSPGVDRFNACLGQDRFLITTERKSGGSVIDVIRDRASAAVVGELAVLPSLRAAETFTSAVVGPPSGSGSRDGRTVLFTRSPMGRDATAILACGQTVIPGP